MLSGRKRFVCALLSTRTIRNINNTSVSHSSHRANGSLCFCSVFRHFNAYSIADWLLVHGENYILLYISQCLIRCLSEFHSHGINVIPVRWLVFSVARLAFKLLLGSIATSHHKHTDNNEFETRVHPFALRNTDEKMSTLHSHQTHNDLIIRIRVRVNGCIVRWCCCWTLLLNVAAGDYHKYKPRDGSVLRFAVAVSVSNVRKCAALECNAMQDFRERRCESICFLSHLAICWGVIRQNLLLLLAVAVRLIFGRTDNAFSRCLDVGFKWRRWVRELFR